MTPQKKKPEPSRYPPLPKKLTMAGGPVSVVIVDTITERNVDCVGLYDPEHRLISIKKGKRSFQWNVLFHELTHAALIDAGLHNMLKDKLHEAICDAIAIARMRERFQ